MPMFLLKLRTDIEYTALALPQVKLSAKDIDAFLSAYTGWFKRGQGVSEIKQSPTN